MVQTCVHQTLIQFGMTMLCCFLVRSRADDYSWRRPHAGLQANGPVDLQWQPKPFTMRTGNVLRYIDFRNGNDQNDGKTPASAWKHHPWDTNAADSLRTRARQDHVDTYIFKRGVIYRGLLEARESGTDRSPIILTSSPEWGTGDAVLAGSEKIAGPWSKVASPAQLRFPRHVNGVIWQVSIPPGKIPMLAWEVDPRGKWQRLKLARDPNWQDSDPYRPGINWWRWTSITKGWPEMAATDPVHLKRSYSLEGATIWTDRPGNNFAWSPPAPTVIRKHDRKTGTVRFLINHPGKYPHKGSRYFLENHPAFLDEPGEWYYDTKRKVFYLCLAPGRDPNRLHIEIARRLRIINIQDQHDIEIAGLTFRGANAPDPSLFSHCREGMRKNEWLSYRMGAVRLRGNVSRVNIHHCRFFTTTMGVAGTPHRDGDMLDGIRVADCEFRELDDSAVMLDNGIPWRYLPMGRVHRARIMRNFIEKVGLRSIGRSSQGINCGGLEIGEIAGNIIHRTGAQGINVFCGKSVGGITSQITKQGGRPLVRVLIHHNKATETLLLCQDFGGIESWGGGPSYMYNNISAVAVGWIMHNGWFHKNQPYYLDHQFKGYFLNNIGWGIAHKDAWEGRMTAHFMHQAQGILSTVFHNTGYGTRDGFYKDGVMHSRDYYLGNLLMAMPNAFFGQPHLKGNTTAAYANNILVGTPKNIFAVYRQDKFQTFPAFQQFLEAQKALLAQVGWQIQNIPVRDPERHDFRPLPGSEVIDRGVKVFVPWGLCEVTGEWHFRLHRADPNIVLGENFSLDKEHVKGREFHRFPRNDLVGQGIPASAYIASPHEDWIPSALLFDGKRTLQQEKLDKPYLCTRLDPDNRNFLIEIIFRIDKSNEATLVEKMAGSTGYRLQLQNGKAQFTISAAGTQNAIATRSPLVCGRWYHLIVEVDRKHSRLQLYLDGKMIAQEPISIAAEASLSNAGVFTVGHNFVGALDFLRFSRGTLRDAYTDIAELYEWQFNGPQLYDFAGRPPVGAKRDVGALELQ